VTNAGRRASTIVILDQSNGPSPAVPVDPRVYLAAERTYLAWIRTGLALMGFGFVVARFGLFLRELALTSAAAQVPRHAVSATFGTGLVILGVVLTVGAVLRYFHVLRDLERGTDLRRPSRLALALGFTLATAGCAISAYLLLTF
jgi:putative membrane protein